MTKVLFYWPWIILENKGPSILFLPTSCEMGWKQKRFKKTLYVFWLVMAETFFVRNSNFYFVVHNKEEWDSNFLTIKKIRKMWMGCKQFFATIVYLLKQNKGLLDTDFLWRKKSKKCRRKKAYTLYGSTYFFAENIPEAKSLSKPICLLKVSNENKK